MTVARRPNRPGGEPAALLRPRDPVASVPRLGPSKASKLVETGIATVGDFLLALPFRYEDRGRFSSVSSLTAGAPATIRAKLTSVRSTRMRRGTMRIEALADDGTGAIRVVWHNRYASFAASAEGAHGVLYGTPAVGSRGELRIENPETEFFAEEESDPVHSGRIVGVYHRAAGISPRLWRGLVRSTLDRLGTDWPAATATGMELKAVFERAHFPESIEDAEVARRALAAEEILLLAAGIERRRDRLRERTGMVLRADDALRAKTRSSLPFALTGAQKRAVREIASDLASGRAMARLLQGDVGSGKTVVAGLAFLLAAANGAQGALMAPTEILAEQHAASLAGWMEKAGMRLGLLTGRVRGRKRWVAPAVTYGLNPMTAFVGSGMMARAMGLIHVPMGGESVSLQQAIYRTLFASWLEPRNASLAYAVGFVMLWYGILRVLERRGVVLKV